MDHKVLEEHYWRTLTKAANMPDIKNATSFYFMDSDAWNWSVWIYALVLRDYCNNLPFSKILLPQYVTNTNHIVSKHHQAQKILALLNIKDESEEGWWLKKFRYEFDQVSGKSGFPDKRSFTLSERPKFFDKVKELAQKVEFTSIVLGLALIATAHMRSSEERRVKKLLDVLPEKAEEFFLPKSAVILKTS